MCEDDIALNVNEQIKLFVRFASRMLKRGSLGSTNVLVSRSLELETDNLIVKVSGCDNVLGSLNIEYFDRNRYPLFQCDTDSLKTKKQLYRSLVDVIDALEIDA